MDKVLLKAEADKRWWNIMCICSIIILFIGAFLLFSALTEESKPYLSYYQDTKRSQDIIIFIIILLGGLFLYIPTRQSTLHGVLVHDFRRYSARFPVISACGLFRYRYSGFC